MQRFCLSLDLRPDERLAEEYVRLHREVWPEVQSSLSDAGVLQMEIYRLGFRLFMLMDTTDEFSLERKAAMDASNPKVLEWEQLMLRFQDADPSADPTRRWRPMERVFQLHPDAPRGTGLA